MPEVEPRQNVDYFRKLHQQIVQKDNIIKLLQLQLKELEASTADPDAVDRLTSALGDAEARLAEYEEQDDAAAGDARRLLELEEELDRLRDAAEDAERLRAELSLSREELARHKELLESAESEGVALDTLRRELDGVTEERDRLREELGRAREAVARAPREAAPVEVQALEERIEDLEAALEIARDTVERLQQAPEPLAGDGPDTRAVARQVIEALQVLEDHGRELYSAEEALDAVEAALRGLGESLGLERIATVGETFDPDRHALGRVHYSSEGEHDGVVAEEVAGYRIGDRVVKLAQVTVCRNPWFCERCRKVVVAGAAFCHVCGGRIAQRKGSAGAEAPARRPRDEARHLLDVARAMLRRGDTDGGREKLRKAEEIAPEDPKVALEMALLEEAEGRFADAAARLGALPPEVPGLRDLDRHRARLEGKVEIMERLRTVR